MPCNPINLTNNTKYNEKIPLSLLKEMTCAWSLQKKTPVHLFIGADKTLRPSIHPSISSFVFHIQYFQCLLARSSVDTHFQDGSDQCQARGQTDPRWTRTKICLQPLNYRSLRRAVLTAPSRQLWRFVSYYFRSNVFGRESTVPRESRAPHTNA